MSFRLTIILLAILVSGSLGAAMLILHQPPEPFALMELMEGEPEAGTSAAVVEEAEAPVEEVIAEPEVTEPTAPEAPAKPSVSANASAHLCYLSFNNPYEASVARNFAARLAKYPDAPKITVTEYQAKGADPEKALASLVRSGTQCDGLVLSGHHDEDGEFWGDRTSGDLEIDFLYELSSHPKLSAWFSNVKALWLQGCHTATTRVFNPDVDSEDRISGSPLTMINRHLDFRDLEGTLDDLNDIFLENTEEDNIILDYGRVFPSATIYTWWDKSPGVESGSHWSLPFHIAQTSFVIDPDPRFFKSPLKKSVPEDAALRYAEILYESMTRPTWPRKHSGPLQGDEDLFIKGWKEHGRWAVHRREYSFENASAVGHRSLLSSNSGILKQLRGFVTLLHQLDEEWVAENPTAIVDTILGHEEYIPYNVYLLWAIAQRSPALKAKIQANMDFRQHLEWMSQSESEDSRMKRDYRRLHAYLYPQDKVASLDEESD